MITRLTDWLRDEDGAIAPFLVLMLIPIIGMIALGGEVSSWYMKERQLQNAADTAALAAATNNTTADVNGIPSYQREAYGAAGVYGFQTKTNGDMTVTPSVTDCPGSTSGANDCYQVVIQQRVPLYLAQVIGYTGNTHLGGTASGPLAVTVAALAVARPHVPPAEYCLVGLSQSGTSFRINGGSFVDFNGCSVMSNSKATCNGANSDTNMGYGDAANTSNCGDPARSNRPVLADPYFGLNASPPIPTGTPCTTNTPISISGTIGTTFAPCGAKLTGDVTVTTPNTILTLNDGPLDLNGHNLTTSGDGSLTIILTGTKHQTGSTTFDHTIKGSGTLDITAPTSGTSAVDGGLKGVAILQDYRISGCTVSSSSCSEGAKDIVDMDYSGNSPKLVITGLIYMPLSDFTVRGAIDHRIGYLYCVSVVTKTILADGTGALYSNSSQDCHVNDFLTGLEVAGTEARQVLVK
jgi:Flp pilus assembly protein TadG